MSRSHLLSAGFALLVAILACTAPGAATLTPVGTASPQVIVVTATQPAATSGAPAPTNAQPTPTLPSGGGGPHFTSEIRFSTQPDPATATRTFPAKTKRVYAMWDYSGMTVGLTVRREWYLNGTPWLKRAAAWDFTKYGASGTVTDISIFDLEQGLPSGHYELRLYIDDRAQFAGDADVSLRSFDIGTGANAPVHADVGGTLSPDGKLVALVVGGGSLAVQDGSGQTRNIVTAQTIDGFGWLPDSQHIVYSTRQDDTSGTPPGVTYGLWIVNVSTSGATSLSRPGENLHKPILSANGRYIALLKGNGASDACSFDRSLAILEIDPVTLTRVALTLVKDFAGVPAGDAGSSVYADNGPDFDMPGVWQGATQFKTALRYTCSDSSSDGVFMLDMVGKSATKVAGLPQPQ